MFLTEFQVTSYFLVYLALLLVSAVFVLLKDQWTFKDKLLRLLVLFLIPVLGLLMLASRAGNEKNCCNAPKKGD
jgi:hypothetical protein